MSFKLFVSTIFLSLILQANNVWICVTSTTIDELEFYESFELGKNVKLLLTPKDYSSCDQNIEVINSKNLFYGEGSVDSDETLFKQNNKGIYRIKNTKRSKNHDILTYTRKLDFSTLQKFSSPKSLDIRSRTAPTLSLNRSRLISYLKQVSGEAPIILNGQETYLTDRYTKEGAKRTWTYLKSFFESLGYETKLHCYAKDGFFTREACNVEATKYGKDRDNFLVLGGHFDSVTENCADDNGSGISTVMEVAKSLQDRDIDIGIKFLAFDQEERGLKGSKAYAKLIKSQGVNIKAAFIVDTMGYDGDNDGKMHIIDCDKSESVKLSNLFMRGMSSNLERSPTCTNRSDHSSFWNIGVPAIIMSENFFGGDPTPCYHKKCDTVSSLNLDFMYSIADSLAKAIDSAVGM